MNRILQRPIRKRSASAVQYTIEREATASFPWHGRPNMSKLRVFVSSVQKEMETERVAIASLITTDP